MYIVDDFKANIFIGINILIFKGIVINLYIKTFIFGKCLRFQILFDVVVKLNPYFKRIIRFKSVIIIVLGIIMKVLVIYNNNISYNRDFLFELNYV